MCVSSSSSGGTSRKRPRPEQVHLAAQDVDELRQLVEPRGTQPPADPRQTVALSAAHSECGAVAATLGQPHHDSVGPGLLDDLGQAIDGTEPW